MSQPDQNQPAVMALPEIKRAYSAYTAEVRVRNSKVACALVMALMPAGFVLDSFVYHDARWQFLELRCIASALALLVFLGLRRPNLAGWQSRLLCMGWYVLPAFFISWMIGATDGYTSAYYAGLNLVILAVSSVIQATLQESIIAVGLVLFMYVTACVLHPVLNPTGRVFYSYNSQQSLGMLVNNWYFILLTSIIVVTGNFFFNRLRFREFMLRFELDRNRRMLEDSNQKLKELDEVKSRFFANISHELRTPLTLLLAPLETLLHRFSRPLDAESRSLLGTMHANGMRLLKLINDLLDLVRLESGVMHVKQEPLELLEFVKGLSSSARQVADDKRLKLETFVDQELGTVLTDRDKLEKIVLNLVFNALKFTPAGGTVSLRAEKQGGEMVLLVRDTGMGISAKNLPHVFDRFWQADDSARRKYQGVGIGLALVKELVEIQNGKVTVESEEGRGTTFTVRLPYQKADAAAMTKVAEEAAAAATAAKTIADAGGSVTSQEWLSNLYRRAELFPAMTPLQETLRPVEPARNGDNRPSLLVADDEPDMLRFLKSQLDPHYRVLEAVDGQQAVDKAGQFLPDIILLDMMMPEKDGLQACREIRARNSTQTIPVILLTARADEETKLAALGAGASDFLSKPFSTTELHVRIKNLVESHQYQIKLSKQNQVLESTIDQLKETETLLVQTEKMVSLGRMSAGIIHEINNPLNYATTGLFTLRKKGSLLAPDQRAEYEDILKDVEEGIGRVKSIVTDLKTFTHPDTEQVDYVDATAMITSALRFLSNEWKDRVEIRQILAPGLLIRGNRNKLLQVFVNLLQNSLDALKRKSFTDEKPAISIESALAGGKAVVTIRDNGEGIEAATLDKIFDPFFTTKDVGEGMGLGLTICYRIIQEYDGHISVRSERGKFCEFKLEFPAKK
jgi:signal transduction histidine kinase